MEYILVAAMCIVIGFMSGYLVARYQDNRNIDSERAYYKMSMRNETQRHVDQVARKDILFEIEKRELTQRHTKILDEIAQVTGIDVVELPSFGTINLNHSKCVREAMQALYEEDTDELYSD